MYSTPHTSVEGIVITDYTNQTTATTIHYMTDVKSMYVHKTMAMHTQLRRRTTQQ